MNRSRSVSETSVGLFAFLDVLMSTMGSLILVLMVVTPKIRQEAVARAATEARRAVEAGHATESRGAVEEKKAVEKKPPPYVPPPVIELPRTTVDLNAKLKVQLAELSQEAKERQRIADDKHEALGAAQASLQKNLAEMQELERRLALIRQTKDRLADSVTKVSSEGIEIESQLARTAARLRTIRGQIAHASTEYTFVAYDGVSGTTRHPILIECTREHIKFLQEDISLSSADVSGYSPSYNPVLAGAQALMDYWATHSAPGDPRPYVLIVVRPSGTIAYYAARRLLERMKEPFGYELLPDDQKLDVPPPVPEAAEACRKAVEKAIAERVDVFKQVFGNGARGGPGGKLASASGSGTDPSGGSRAQTGGTKSPFDDLDGSPNQQTGPGGTASGATVAQSEAESPGRASTRNGPMANGTSETPTSGTSGPGTLAFGTSASGKLASDTSAPGTSAPGTSAPGTSASGTLASGTPTPGTGAPGSGRPGAAMLSDTGVPGSAQTASGPVSGGLSDTGSRGVGSPGTGSSSAGSPGSGSPVTGSPTGSPVIGSRGSGSPGAGSPGSGSPDSGSPGTDTSESGFASTGPSGTGAPGTEAAIAASQSEFPPPIIPRSGMGETSNAAAGSERLAIGHPTSGSAGNENSDGQPQPGTSQPGGLESGSFASESQSGSPQSGSMQSGGFPSGGDASGTARGGGLQSGSAGSGPAQLEPPEFGSSTGGSSSPGGTSPGGSPQSGSDGQPNSGQGGGTPSFGSSASSDSGADGGQSGAGSDSPGAKAMDGLPSFATSADDDGAPHRPNRSTTHRWGISSPRASIGFEHDVMIYIEARRICVGGQPPISCGRGESSERLSFAVLREIDREARSWGRPRENFYWVPNLKIAISPGGNLQYERIQPAFQRHGLSSTVDFRLELSRPAPMPSLVTE
jgi:flagellar motility protein MotE (MotC chaperone)